MVRYAKAKLHVLLGWAGVAMFQLMNISSIYGAFLHAQGMPLSALLYYSLALFFILINALIYKQKIHIVNCLLGITSNLLIMAVLYV